jgi:transposase
MAATDESMQLVERVAALDIGKAMLVACIRVPAERVPDRRRQEVIEYATTTGALLRLADRLRELRLTRVAMESTSDYWKPVFYLLEAEASTAGCSTPTTFGTYPAGPRLTSWTRYGWPRWSSAACAPSFIPPPPIRRLRDLTRYRRSLIRDRTREKQRLEKLLEDAQITPRHGEPAVQ